jgi:uncharacterized membrane protein YvbJ
LYCRNCGNKVKDAKAACPKCGVNPQTGIKFCPSCAAPTTPFTEVCVKCGMQLPMQAIAVKKSSKSKPTAVILAVFFGCFSWLYTYKRDKWKFWAGIAAVVAAVALLGIYITFTWTVVMVVWVAAIVDTVVKKERWYVTY